MLKEKTKIAEGTVLRSGRWTSFLPHLEDLSLQLQFKRDMLIECLKKELPGLIEFIVPEGGLHLWCKLIPDITEGKLLEESILSGTVFVPGSVYGSDPGYVRFTFARAKLEQIAPGIAGFAQALRRLMG